MAPHEDDGRFCLIDYQPLARELRDAVCNERIANVPKIVPRLKAFVDASRSDSLQGDAVLAKLYSALDSCGLTRTSTQRFFHQQFVHSILPWIYGKKDFARYKERILFESGIHPDKAVRVLNTEYFFVNASSYDEPVSICDFKVYSTCGTSLSTINTLSSAHLGAGGRRPRSGSSSRPCSSPSPNRGSPSIRRDAALRRRSLTWCTNSSWS